MELKIEYLDKTALKPYVNNAKIHTPEQVEQIKKSIREFGFNDPVAVWHDNEIVEGHGRLLAAMEMDEIEAVPVIRLDDLTDEQRRAYMLIHNKLTMNTGFDIDLLNIELDDITNIDMKDFGFELEIEFNPQEEAKGSMKEKYLVPPFSVIYGNKPDWLARKRDWVAKGLHSEIGRGGGRLTFNSMSNPEANIVRVGGVQSGAEQSLQKQQQAQRVSKKKSKAYADGLIEKREKIRKGTYRGNTV